MTTYFNNAVFDDGLSTLTSNVNKLVMCTALPTTFTEANSTYKVGEKTSHTVGSPGDRSGGGREVVGPAITDGAGDVTAEGDPASHWAWVSGTVLYVATTLATPISLGPTSNQFNLEVQTVGIPSS
ncbi:MAG: hypothetical protein EA420_03405 [Candidatus Competibacteraceae bacterium]|nr:MAG: hypothetical protein EA420_03405 [Candidatus Competibacteraceae bacterium]